MGAIATLPSTLRPECAAWCTGGHVGRCCVETTGAVPLAGRVTPARVRLYRDRQNGPGPSWVSVDRIPERITPAEAAELGAALLRAAALAEDASHASALADIDPMPSPVRLDLAAA